MEGVTEGGREGGRPGFPTNGNRMCAGSTLLNHLPIPLCSDRLRAHFPVNRPPCPGPSPSPLLEAASHALPCPPHMTQRPVFRGQQHMGRCQHPRHRQRRVGPGRCGTAPHSVAVGDPRKGGLRATPPAPHVSRVPPGATVHCRGALESARRVSHKTCVFRLCASCTLASLQSPTASHGFGLGQSTHYVSDPLPQPLWGIIVALDSSEP